MLVAKRITGRYAVPGGYIEPRGFGLYCTERHGFCQLVGAKGERANFPYVLPRRRDMGLVADSVSVSDTYKVPSMRGVRRRR